MTIEVMNAIQSSIQIVKTKLIIPKTIMISNSTGIIVSGTLGDLVLLFPNWVNCESYIKNAENVMDIEELIEGEKR